MVAKTLSTSSSPRVVIEEIAGNLTVTGSTQSKVEVIADDQDSISLDLIDDCVHISCRDDCRVELPGQADLQVKLVQKNAYFKNLSNTLSIGTVSGSTELNKTGDTIIETVNGNLSATKLSGNLNVNQVDGNTTVRDIKGSCILKNIEGNLLAKSLQGNLDVDHIYGNANVKVIKGTLSLNKVDGNLNITEVENSTTARVSGNARVSLKKLAGERLAISADGNLYCRLFDSINAKVHLTSHSNNILVKLPDKRNLYNKKIHEFTLGSGEGSIDLSSEASLIFNCKKIDREEDTTTTRISSDNFDVFSEDFSQQITEQIETQLKAHLAILDEHLENLSNVAGEAGLPEEEMKHILQRARSSSERATTRAREKMLRSQEKLERKLEKKFAAAQRKAEKKAKAALRKHRKPHRHSWKLHTKASTTPRSTVDKVSDQERLTILKMLETKKITLEEAEILLSTLEKE